MFVSLEVGMRYPFYVLCVMIYSLLIDDASLHLVMMDENAFINLRYNAYARAKQQKRI